MKKKLFLIGPNQCGKSEMIRAALGSDLRRAGGFITLRELDSQGNVIGFDLASADGSGTRSRFLEFVDGDPVTHLDVFSQKGTWLLRQAEQRPFAVLDELGGIEILGEGFTRALAQLLSSGTPCIGVMKGPGPGGKMVGIMGVNLRYELSRRVLYDLLQEDPDTMLVETTGKDDQEVLALVEQWAAEYARTK